MEENYGLCGNLEIMSDHLQLIDLDLRLHREGVIIETHLSSLEERLLDIEIASKRLNNLTKEEREALYSLKDDPSIIDKGADKGSVVIVWDREDYLKEAYRQLDDKEVYEQVPDDPSVLANTLIKALEKIRLRGGFVKGHYRLFFS